MFMEEEISDKDHKDDDDIEVASLNEVIVKSTVEKMEIDNSRDAHYGNKISSVSISPNGTYAVTYCGDDNSIEGWIIEDSKLVLNSKSPFKLSDSFYILTEKSIRIKVNNSQIVCCYTRNNYSGYDDKYIKIEVYQMTSEPRLIKLNPPIKFWPDSYEWPIFNFKKNNDLIIFQSNILSVYSQNNKINGDLILKSSSRLSGRIIGVTIDVDNDNIWAISDNYLFKWDLETLELKFSYSLGFTVIYNIDMKDKDLTIISKANLTIVKYYNEIVIFSKDVHYPIRKIQTEISNIKVKLLYDSQNYYLLVFNMPKKDEKQNIFLYHPSDINKKPVDISKIFKEDNSNNNFILYEYNSESKVAIGLVNGRFSCINLSNKKWHEFFDKEIEESSTPFEKDVCNDTLLVPDMENIKSLFLKKRTIIYTFKMLEFKDKKYHWRILKEGNGYVLSVLDSNGVSCSKKVIPRLRNFEILGNNALVIRLDNYQLIIFEYDHDNKEIKGKYYFKVEPLFESSFINKFSGNILPITDINTVGVCKKNTDFYAIWSEMIISLIEDDKYFEKYGATLLPMLIKSNDPKSAHHIKEIYNKCIKLVKEDLKRNLKLLNIITSSIPIF
ncbi:18499_t:CDS:2 [Rhizophagus irregularis]|nr:18499_t:CDS:2 [Rhizophagus irregularis]